MEKIIFAGTFFFLQKINFGKMERKKIIYYLGRVGKVERTL